MPHPRDPEEASPPPSGSDDDSDRAPEDDDNDDSVDGPQLQKESRSSPVAASPLQKSNNNTASPASSASPGIKKSASSGVYADSSSSAFNATSKSSAASDAALATARAAARRQRTSVIWNPPSGSASSAPGHAPKIRRDRTLHLLEQALRYRMIMKPKSVAPSRAEMSHINALLYSFLQANGCGRTAAQVRDALASAGSGSSSSSSLGLTGAASANLLEDITIGERLDFALIIADASRRTCLLFDDDSLSRTDNHLAREIDLQVFDPSSNAVGGTIDLLLEKLVFTESDFPSMAGKPDINFTTVFMLTNSLFVTPEALFSKLAKMFKTVKSQQPLLGEAKTLAHQKRILHILHAYLVFSSVDVSKLLLERVTTFCVSIVQQQHSHVDCIKLATSLHGKLQEIAASSLKYPTALGTLHTDVAAALLEVPPSTMADDKVVAGIVDVDDTELCRQLCLLSAELARRIHPRELLHGAWTDPAMKVLSTNLFEYTNFRQRLSRWIASLVTTPSDVATRLTVLRKIIRLGRALYNCQNFDMVSVVLEGLRHQAVSRLKQTFAGLTPGEREELEGLNKVVDPFDSTLRDTPYQIASPTIPLLPPFISVFFRAEESGKTIIVQPDGTQLVNWSKMLALAKPLIRWVAFQSTPYRYRILPNVQRFLWQCPGIRHDDALLAVSRAREMPPAGK